MKKIYFLFFTLILYSCTSLEDAGKVLRNEKIKTTDEFLIKKKEPLVLPPDYNEIPKPGSLSNKTKNKNNLKKILKSNDKKTTNNTGSSSVENSIINKIKK